MGLYYGSSTGITEYIAEEVQEAWEKAGMKPIEAVNITDVSDISVLLDYDCLILGIPTWNIGQLQDDWEIVFPQLDQLDFTGKKVAIFGIGDMRGYPDNFLDAVGILGKKLIERHAQLVGYWYDEHYKFRESLGFVDSKFMGLGIDDTNQSKLNSQRIDGWVAQLINEFALQPTAVS
ncbi:MAG: flavodoxin [Chloroflexi bacterium]|nr:flavodoxin [Chloroflexota bacterium]